MAAGFQADFDLGRHAGHLDEGGESLRGATRAARMVSIPDEAFGQFCWRFSGMLRPLERLGVAALDRAVEATEAAATAIAATAAAYRDVDEGLGKKVPRA
jgi:hypothetical protein